MMNDLRKSWSDLTNFVGEQLELLFREQVGIDKSIEWFDSCISEHAKCVESRKFYFAFSGTTRQVARRPVRITERFAKKMHGEYPGIELKDWSLDRLLRVLLLRLVYKQDSSVSDEVLPTLFNTADMNELVALYSSFMVNPHAGSDLFQATEGARSNIVSVFDALALHHPYPAFHFDDAAWNQLILKAFFNDRPIYRIFGLEERANAVLAEALSNYAHERWAAGRSVSPELWRSCQDFLTDSILADLARVASEDDRWGMQAAALVAAHSSHSRAGEIAHFKEPFSSELSSGSLTWDSLGHEVESHND